MPDRPLDQRPEQYGSVGEVGVHRRAGDTGLGSDSRDRRLLTAVEQPLGCVEDRLQVVLGDRAP